MCVRVCVCACMRGQTWVVVGVYPHACLQGNTPKTKQRALTQELRHFNSPSVQDQTEKLLCNMKHNLVVWETS